MVHNKPVSPFKLPPATCPSPGSAGLGPAPVIPGSETWRAALRLLTGGEGWGVAALPRDDRLLRERALP